MWMITNRRWKARWPSSEQGLDSKGFTEATITRQGNDKIRVEIPINNTSEMQDPNEISKFIGTPAKLKFIDPDGNTVMEGSDIKSARMVIGTSGIPEVNFTLSDEGKKKFAEATSRLVGQEISIVLDDVVISSPKVEGVIPNGRGVITSPNFTTDSASELAMQIESGALPIVLNEIEVRSMSATLGQDALQNSVYAGIVGMIILFAFMIAYYRVPGLIACITLTLYLDLVLMLLGSVPGVQLTLPGIAGIILGIGMAVDANVIIYERFREEVWAGKTLRVAQKAGFHKAFITYYGRQYNHADQCDRFGRLRHRHNQEFCVYADHQHYCFYVLCAYCSQVAYEMDDQPEYQKNRIFCPQT